MPAQAGIHDFIPMIRAQKIAHGSEWQTARAEITLDYDRRHRRRLRLHAGETEILLDLPEAIHIRNGDALALEDGTFIAVRAADEALLEIRAPDADTLTKLAWHLGNRHLAVEFRPGALRILHDHVIAEMIPGLGGTATKFLLRSTRNQGPTLMTDDPDTQHPRHGRNDHPRLAGALLRLLTWLSPAFPTGGFAYSHGLEWSVETGDVRDEPTLIAWIESLLTHGALWSDTILFRHAHRGEKPTDLATLATALAPASERRLETTAQGAAFALAAAAWPTTALQNWGDAPLPYPIAIGLLAAANAVPEDDAAIAYLHAATANLISAAIRLIPLGQVSGLRAQSALEPAILATATATTSATLDDLGTAAWTSDIAAMRHETQYTRLFRT